MNPADATDLIRQALWMVFWTSLPLLGIGLIVGVAVSLVQVLTSIQDPGFNTLPRLAAFFGSCLVSLPWMAGKLISYTAALFSDFSRYCR